MRNIIVAIIFAFALSSFCLGSVISDIDKSDIELSTRFDGTSLLVFGALSPEGDKKSLLVEVVGPPTSVDIRKKVQIWGIWVNKKIAQFRKRPSGTFENYNLPWRLISNRSPSSGYSSQNRRPKFVIFIRESLRK